MCQSMSNPHLHNGLNKVLQTIVESDDWLDVQEKISLVFLMCEDAQYAHFILTENIECQYKPRKILHDLFDYLVRSGFDHIESKILESLICIKNYKLIHLLGYTAFERDKLKGMIKTTENGYINSVRKTLLSMCENMSDQDLANLIDRIKCDFKRHGSHFKDYGSKQMEMNLLFYIGQGYICDGIGDTCDLSNLLQHLKQMNLHHISENLEKVEARVIAEYHTKFFTDNGCIQNNISVVNLPLFKTNEDDCYVMDENNMGLCIIVNQRNFPKAMLRGNNKVTFDGFRHGTDVDRDMLKITFAGFGYKVIVLENLESIQLQKSIRSIVRHDVVSRDSSLILCILSHGKRDAIYCVNGIDVPVEEIEKWILGGECPQLRGKPKLLFIQACQGNDFQKALPRPQDTDDNAMLESDGPEKLVPPTADLLTFWSTVPGYSSFRRVDSGSVFIQELCAQLLKHGHSDHLNDIVLYVNKQLSEKHFGRSSFVSMSQAKHTITKKMYFPCIQKFRMNATLELFKKYFLEFLIKECITILSAEKCFYYEKWNRLM